MSNHTFIHLKSTHVKPKNLTISELVTHSSTQVKRENQEFLRSASDFEKQAELQRVFELVAKKNGFLIFRI